MLAMTVGCVKTDDISAEQAGVMTLQLRNNELVATRATTAGVVDLNENLISTVQCFFSTDGATVLYATDVIEVKDSDGVVENLPLIIPADKMGTLFPGEATNCNIYVVANTPKITATTISAIKETSISLAADGNNAQPTFVMDGSAEVTKASDNSISGTVNLTRAAAKILVTANINTEIVFSTGEGESVKTETWTPDMESIRMTYHNSATESKLSAGAKDASGYSNYAQQPKTKEDGTLGEVFTYTEGADKYVATQVIPFYSYPRAWDDNATNKPYIELVIPWKRTNETQYSTYTYQIPLDIDAKTLVRNNLYKLTVNVGILGSLTGDVTLSPSYVVIDWGKGTINAELSRPKYLVVDQHHYVLNNETSLEIPFHSSDKCVISVASCTQTNLKTNATSTITRNDSATTITNKSYALSIDNETRIATLVHGLNNDLYDGTDDANGIFDFTPYEYTITIQHESDPSFSETVTITQYPAMYATADPNSDSTNGGGDNEDNGFVWVNGYQGSYYKSDDRPSSGSNYSQSNFDDAQGSTDSSLKAVSMYVFTVSSLEGTKYVLGDPRTQSPNNLEEYGFTWGSGRILGTTNETRVGPMYYLPTDANLADGENSHTYNMIAPKFRVCSVYGAIDTNGARQYYENMKARCASYQEDGYPAGRWRLPTAAEFELINTLSMKELLPALYASTMDYWCAHGYGRYNTTQNKVVITPNDSDYGSADVSVRCVYDDWYWGSEPALKTDAEKEVFTWGDQPR